MRETNGQRYERREISKEGRVHEGVKVNERNRRNSFARAVTSVAQAQSNVARAHAFTHTHTHTHTHFLAPPRNTRDIIEDSSVGKCVCTLSLVV